MECFSFNSSFTVIDGMPQLITNGTLIEGAESSGLAA